MEQNQDKKPLGVTPFVIIGIAFLLLFISNGIGDIKSSKKFY